MRLCTCAIDGVPFPGIVRDDGSVVDLRRLANAPDMLSLIERAAVADVDLEELGARAGRAGRAEAVQHQRLQWLPPVPRPGKIIGVALNNRIGQQIAVRPFADPAFFLKPSSSLVGHDAPVIVRKDDRLTHPEPELALVIGKPGRDIAETAALSHVFGYTIFNDITSPGLKERDSIELVVPRGSGGGYGDLLGWRHVRDDDHARSIYLTYHTLSKGADTFGPCGPWIVTADEIADPNDLSIRSYAGDVPVFEDSTANLTFPVRRIISHASRYMTLEAGDIIHCGTAMRPVPDGPFRGLTDWNLVRDTRTMAIEIAGIGRLANPVRIAP